MFQATTWNIFSPWIFWDLAGMDKADKNQLSMWIGLQYVT